MKLGLAAWGLLISLSAPPDASTGEPALWPVDESARATCASFRKELTAYRWRPGEEASPSRKSADRWSQRALFCPGVPAILLEAARRELVAWRPFPNGIDAATPLDTWVKEERLLKIKARDWLLRAQRDWNEKETPAFAYWLSRAHLALGDLPAAKSELRRARTARLRPQWELDRVAALLAMLEGDAARSVEFAHRSRRAASRGDQIRSNYVYALSLVRAGRLADADTVMQEAMRQDHARLLWGSLRAYLPIHEALFLVAYGHSLSLTEHSVAIRMWDAYLARPEPGTGERRFAQAMRNQIAH